MIYPLHNESMIAMTTSSVKKISINTTQLMTIKKTSREGLDLRQWLSLVHSIDDGARLGLCTVRVVDVCEREGICVALQRWVGEAQRKSKKRRTRRLDSLST